MITNAKDRKTTPDGTAAILQAEREALLKTTPKDQDRTPKSQIEPANTILTRPEPDRYIQGRLDALREKEAPKSTPEKEITADRGFTVRPSERVSANTEARSEPKQVQTEAATLENREKQKVPATSRADTKPVEDIAIKLKEAAQTKPAKEPIKPPQPVTKQSAPSKADKSALETPQVRASTKDTLRQPEKAKESAATTKLPARSTLRPADSVKIIQTKAAVITARIDHAIQREAVRKKIAESLKDVTRDVARTIAQLPAVRTSPERSAAVDKSLQKAVLEKLKQLLQLGDLTNKERAILRELKHLLLAKRAAQVYRKHLGGARGEGRGSSGRPALQFRGKDRGFIKQPALRSGIKKLPPALQKELLKVLNGGKLNEKQALRLLKAIQGKGSLGALSSCRTDRLLAKAAKVLQKFLLEQKFEDLQKFKQAQLKNMSQTKKPGSTLERKEPLFKRALRAARGAIFGATPEAEDLLEPAEHAQDSKILVQTIYGRVTDGETGQPVPGVLIDGGNLGSVETDENGRYRLTNIAPGTYYEIIPGLQLCTFSPQKQSGIMGTLSIRHDFTLYW